MSYIAIHTTVGDNTCRKKLSNNSCRYTCNRHRYTLV